MNERRIWLVRHAPTAWTVHRLCGRSDPPLGEAGSRVAAATAARVAALVPRGARIVSSPLRRAVATARPIATSLGSSAEIDAAWSEVDMGAADGLTFDELEAAWPDVAAALLRSEAVDRGPIRIVLAALGRDVLHLAPGDLVPLDQAPRMARRTSTLGPCTGRASGPSHRASRLR